MKYLRYFAYLAFAITTMTFVGCENDDTDFSDYFNSQTDEDDDSSTDDGDEDDDSSSTDTSTASVTVVYSSSSATVTVSDDIADYITVTQSGAHVNIAQSDDVASEITYTLSGSSSDGEFYMSGSYKATLILNGLTLTNATPVSSGAAIHIQNGKRINVKLAEGTTNTLKDATSGDQKAALYVKGHAEFKQKGTLNVYGNYNHAIKAGEYISIKNATINVLSAVADGINCNEYFLMESGVVNVSGVGDEGLQCDLEGDTTTGETTDHEDEDSGNIYIQGGELSVITPSGAGKAITSEGDITVSDGSIYAYSTDKNAIDAAGNCYLTGGLTYAVGGTDKVAVDVDSDQDKKLYVSGGTLIAIGGFESSASITQKCYSASSWTKSTWYGLTSDSTIAFKTPSSGATGLVVSTSSTPTLTSGVSASGTSILNELVYTDATVSGGSEVTLSSYTGGTISADESTDDSDDEEEESTDDGDDDSTVVDGTAAVTVVYDGTSATITMTEDISSYLTVTKSGAHVNIAQSSDLATEITYTLSGSSSDGEFYMSGSYKATLVLDGLTLTNATPVSSGAAIHIENSKRIDVKVADGTTNTLKDSSSGSQKGALYIKGHAEFKQSGTLNVYGYLKHGIKTGEYMTVKNATINVLASVGDGINVSQYFLMESGTIKLSGIGDDGIQSDIEDTSTGQTTDHEDEDSGNVYLEGGTINASITATAAKGIKAEGDMYITDGTYTVKTTGGGTYDSDDNDAKGAACLKTDGDMTISGGTLSLTSTGSGGKGIKCDGDLTVTGGNVTATASGSKYTYSSSITASPKGIKADGAINVSAGTIVATSSNHEAIEGESTITVTGGYVYASASDDAINAAGDFTISGGYLMGSSSGNDGLDANGNFYLKGGNVFAISTTSPEVAIDANTEGGKQVYITGGNLVAIGGVESGANISGGTAMQASSYSKGTWYALYNGSSLAFAFKVPSNSSMGTPMAVYTTNTPALKSGVTGSGTSFWNGYGYTSASGGSDVSLSSYSSGSSMGGNTGPGGSSSGTPGGR